LFLGNCSFDITDESLKEALGQYGTIESIHWVTDRETGKFYGTGFVEFSTPAEAAAALAADGVEVSGRAIRIQYAKPRAGDSDKKPARAPKPVQPLSEKPPGCKTVFVGGLPMSIDEAQIRTLFTDCGEIVNIRWVERDGQFKGCGFVEFSDEDAVDKAATKNGTLLGNRSIRIDYAAAKAPKSSW